MRFEITHDGVLLYYSIKLKTRNGIPEGKNGRLKDENSLPYYPTKTLLAITCIVLFKKAGKKWELHKFFIFFHFSSFNMFNLVLAKDEIDVGWGLQLKSKEDFKCIFLTVSSEPISRSSGFRDPLIEYFVKCSMLVPFGKA